MKNKYGRSIVIALLTAALLCLSFATASPALAEEPAPELRTVDAATVDEFLKAIGPNTVINLTGRSYDLTGATGYGVYGSKYYGWNEVYDDGWELEIAGVENLTIRAARAGAEIVTAPRYACVLAFVNCKNVTLDGFIAGHTDGPGFCTGAVLHMLGCRDMSVTGCDLYGCGTYGLELDKCRGVHALGTTIRDCSYGAVYANACSDVLLDDCAVHGIEGYGGVFNFYSCHDCAVINSMVRSCTIPSLVDLHSARDIYMAGCEISRNSFDGTFFCTPYPLVLEGCVFKGNSSAYGWYNDSWQQSERVVDPEGKPYADGDFETLTLKENVNWTAPEELSFTAAPVEASEDGMIHVKTVDELLSAIGPDRTIYLEDGVYDLSTASAYGTGSSDYFSWMSGFDGPQLAIQGVENLTIKAAGPHRARIVAVPRYSEVLYFEDCSAITLSGFTAGHNPVIADQGCAGGVLSFSNCRDFKVEDCSLFGCGIVGVSCMGCFGGEVVRTEIHDCSDGACYFYDSRDIALTDCNIHDIGSYYGSYLYQVYSCRNITVNGNTLNEGTC